MSCFAGSWLCSCRLRHRGGGQGVEGMGQNEEMGIMCGEFIVFSFVLVGETCYNSIRRVCRFYRLNRNSLCYMV